MAKGEGVRGQAQKQTTTTAAAPSGSEQAKLVAWLARVGVRQSDRCCPDGRVVWVVDRRPTVLAEISKLRGALRTPMADRRRAWMMSMLAFLLAVVRGRTVEVERLEAAAVKLGEPAALYTVGVWLVEKGRYADAVRALTKALLEGRTEALVELGKLYGRGRGVSHDRRKALALLKRGYRIHGSPEAAYWIGSLYDFELPRRSRLAVSWYRKAAEMGASSAMFNLADLLERGDGVRRSLREALKWYRLAAKAGHMRAHHAIDAIHRGQLLPRS